MKRVVPAIILALMTSVCFAQDEQMEMQTAGEKKITHSIGVQINELIRQVFNFNNTAVNTNNPYLLMYSLNWNKTGWGIRFGGGYSIRSVSTNDGITFTDSDIDILNMRLGFEKAFQLSDKWWAGAGVDAIYNADKDKTKNVIASFDSTITTSNTNITSYGGGAMAWLRYNITPKIQIGTETSFYYRTGDKKQDITIRRTTTSPIGNPQVTTTTSTVDNKIKEGILALPVAFYLIVRF